MIPGAIFSQEIAIANNNVLNEFCNFNKSFVWNKPSGGSNATIINNVGGRQSYFGLGAVSINFTGNSEVTFNSGGSQMRRVIQKTGNYILSYAFNKTDVFSDINFTIELFVNDVLQPNNTITHNLYESSGFVNNQWNTYFQNIYLEYGDVIDFQFKAQSDTTSCYLYFDRLKLEFDDKGCGYPTIYTEAPLDVIEEENTLTIGTILDNSYTTITASLTGADPNDSSKKYVSMSFPEELIALGLEVGVPLVTDVNIVKFNIYNRTGDSITPTADAVYNFKIIR